LNSSRSNGVALIGFGAIGRELARLLEAQGVQITAVLLRRQSENAPANAVQTLEAMIKTRPGLVIECASHEAVIMYGAAVLEAGVDLIISSVGALADDRLQSRLEAATRATGARLIIPSGAIGALDALKSAALVGLDRVTYTSRKPARAWLGTAAQRLLDLESLTEATTFYSGSARAACLDYPQNANVAAAVALSGLGFDGTEVSLIADPVAVENTHCIVAEGEFGRLELTMANRPLLANPKTSAITPASLARVILEQ
jgi:aspartate dehydrogenase